jgi:hypothetical protein
MGVYILLHEVDEKTLIECAGLKGFVTVGFIAGLERQAKRARDTNFTAKRPASVITRSVTTRINLVIAMQHKNTDRPDNRF